MTFTVSIAGVAPDPEVYGGLAAATAYIGSRFRGAYATWRAIVDEDDKERTLVEATAYIDRLPWKGTANGAGGTSLQWPRTGATKADGSAVDSTTVPDAIVDAVFELAAMIADDPDIVAQVDSSSNIKRVKAGSAEVEYHNATSTRNGTATKLPYVIQQLVGPYLAASSVTASGGFGQAGSSCLDDGEDFELNRPF